MIRITGKNKERRRWRKKKMRREWLYAIFAILVLGSQVALIILQQDGSSEPDEVDKIPKTGNTLQWNGIQTASLDVSGTILSEQTKVQLFKSDKIKMDGPDSKLIINSATITGSELRKTLEYQSQFVQAGLSPSDSIRYLDTSSSLVKQTSFLNFLDPILGDNNYFQRNVQGEHVTILRLGGNRTWEIALHVHTREQKSIMATLFCMNAKGQVQDLASTSATQTVYLQTSFSTPSDKSLIGARLEISADFTLDQFDIAAFSNH